MNRRMVSIASAACLGIALAACQEKEGAASLRADARGTIVTAADKVDLSAESVNGKAKGELWRLGVDAFGWETTPPIELSRDGVLRRLHEANCRYYFEHIVPRSDDR